MKHSRSVFIFYSRFFQTYPFPPIIHQWDTAMQQLQRAGSLLTSFVWWKISEWTSEQGAESLRKLSILKRATCEIQTMWLFNVVMIWNLNVTGRKSWADLDPFGAAYVQLFCQHYSGCHTCPSHHVRTIWIWSALCDSLHAAGPQHQPWSSLFFPHSSLRNVTVPTIRSNFSPSLSSELHNTQVSAVYYIQESDNTVDKPGETPGRAFFGINHF